MSYIWSVQFINFKSCARHGFRDFVMKQKMHILVLFLIFSLGIHAQTYEQSMEVLRNCNKMEIRGIFSKVYGYNEPEEYKNKGLITIIVEYNLNSKDLGGWIKWKVNDNTHAYWFYKKTNETSGASEHRCNKKVEGNDVFFYYYNDVQDKTVCTIIGDNPGLFQFYSNKKEDTGCPEKILTEFCGNVATFYNRNGDIIIQDYNVGTVPCKSANLVRVFLDNMFEFLQ